MEQKSKEKKIRGRLLRRVGNKEKRNKLEKTRRTVRGRVKM